MASTLSILQAVSSAGKIGLIASINPKAWDVIPRGGQIEGFEGKAGQPVAFALGVQMLQRVATSAMAGGGRKFAQAFSDDIDDWCGTGWPRRWPFPEPDPSPQPWWQSNDVLIGAALAAAEISVHYAEGPMRDMYSEAAEKLAGAAGLR